MMALLEIVIIVVASAAIVAAVGGLVYMIALTALQERDVHRHTVANAQARRARTQSQMPQQPEREAIRPVPVLVGRAKA